jgi:hypothetical protein
MAYDWATGLSGAGSGAMAGSMFGPIGTVVGGSLGALGGFSSKKKNQTISPEQMMPEWQKNLGSQLGSWVSNNLGNYTPGQAYTGSMPNLQMSGLENLGTDLATKFAQGNMGELFGAGKQQILDTLGGKYANANTSPYIQSLSNLSKINLQDALDQTRASRGALGNYYSTQTVKGEGDVANKSQAQLNSLIGQWMQNERQNQLGAASTAANMGQWETMAPMQAAFQYGGLQRTIDQADYENRYRDFERQRSELSQLPGMALQTYQSNPMYGFMGMNAPQSNASGDLMSLLGGASGQGGLLSQIAGLFGGMGGMGQPGSANVANMGNVLTAPANYYKTGG